MPDPREGGLPIPHVGRLLERLRRRLDALILAHGLGTLLAVVSLWLAFAFIADWLLHVPRAVRLLHLGVALALPVGVVVWTLWRPWRRRPDPSGLALLVERAHPELGELLVSAVQFSERGGGADADPELVRRAVARAEARAAELDLAGVLAPRRPRLRLLAGSLCGLGLLAAVALQPAYASIFLDRLVGGTTAWPQRTRLEVSIPLAAGGEDSSVARRLRVESSPEALDVIVARGHDVPVLVRAEGRVPDEVILLFEGGGRLAIASSGDGLFRTVLRSCQDDVAFRVVGGDDRDGLPRVGVTVLDPPDVTGLAVRVEPPAYSGLEPVLRFDRDVEVLAGSRLTVVARPDPPEARGRVRLLPADRAVELVEMPFPAAGDGAAGGTGLGFELEPLESLRFRFELSDSTGLENPDPGLFAVRVLSDRPPRVELVAPARGELDVVPGGALRVVARASDDYGLTRLAWRAGLGGGADERWGSELELEPRPVPPPAPGDPSPPGASTAGAARVDVARLPALAGAEPDREVAEGDLFVLQAVARDNRPGAEAPEAGEAQGLGRSASVRVRVVSPDEFLRRLQDRLARLRAQASEAEALQREKAQRVRELLTALESDEPEAGARGSELAAALAGQRRVLGDVQALERELAAVLEGVVYARLDEGDAALLDALDERLSRSLSKGFEAATWRELVAQARAPGGPGQGLARQLAAILEVALSAGEDEAPAAAAALDEAARAVALEQVHDALTRAAAAQERNLARLDELIARLAEWDNFQSVLSLARDILNRQKAVRDRTKEALEGR
jgi:hypothetical protein